MKDQGFLNSENIFVINSLSQLWRIFPESRPTLVYDSTRKILESWVEQELQGNLTYDLIANNCIDFVNKVALAAGLDVPETHFQFPKEYLDRLIVMNSAAPNPPDFNVE